MSNIVKTVLESVSGSARSLAKKFITGWLNRQFAKYGGMAAVWVGVTVEDINSFWIVVTGAVLLLIDFVFSWLSRRFLDTKIENLQASLNQAMRRLGVATRTVPPKPQPPAPGAAAVLLLCASLAAFALPSCSMPAAIRERADVGIGTAYVGGYSYGPIRWRLLSEEEAEEVRLAK